MKPAGDQGVLIAYDCSGSTGSDPYYYGFVKKLVEDNLHATVVAWDDHLTEVPREDFFHGRFPKGRGGTNPSVIIPYLATRNFTGHLILLTDGQVGNSEVDQTDRLITQHRVQFTHVSAHFVKICGEFNVAVTAPFTRNCPHDVYHHVNGEVSMPAVVRAEDLASLELIETVNTEEDLVRIFESLERAVVARTMRKDKDPELHDRLTAMQKRVLASISKAVTAESADATKDLVQALEQGDEEGALKAASLITTQYYYKTEDPNALNNRMSRLLSYTGGSLRNVANHTDIASNQARSAVVIQETQLPDEPATDFECPITLDVDAPALIITRGDPILAIFNEQPKLLDRIINNPLAGIRKLTPLITERIDHPIGATTYATGKIEESPLTRAPVLGVLVFGTTRACQLYTDRTVARVLSAKGLKLGNMDLWFAVFLEAIESVAYLDEGIKEAARDHMRWRLRTQKSYASLTGLAQYVATKLPLGACCWYCLASCLVRPTSLGVNTDITRVHAETADALVKLCALVNYRVPEAAVRHAERLAGLFALLNTCKRDGNHGLDGHTLLKLAINALHQNAYEVLPGVFLPVDGPANPEVSGSALGKLYSIGGPFVRKLTVEEIVALGARVNPSLSAGNIDLPVDFRAPDVPQYKVTWPNYFGKVTVPVPVCPLTCRPYYTVKRVVEGREETETWEAAASRVYGGPLISSKKIYAALTQKLKRYPTKEELALEMYRYYVTEKKNPTLPGPLQEHVEETMASFAPIAQELDPDTFVKRFNASVKRPDRQLIEEGRVAPGEVSSTTA